MKRPSTTIASATGEALTDEQRFAIDANPVKVVDALLSRRGRPETHGERYVTAKLARLRKRLR